LTPFEGYAIVISDEGEKPESASGQTKTAEH
jgi:hypothetical protein